MSYSIRYIFRVERFFLPAKELNVRKRTLTFYSSQRNDNNKKELLSFYHTTLEISLLHIKKR